MLLAFIVVSRLLSFKHRVADAGHRVILPCYTKLNASVIWTFVPDDSPTSYLPIYKNGHIQEEFRLRFTVNTSSPMCYDLVITKVHLNDEGYYLSLIHI